MSRAGKFLAKFKSELVIELLQENLNTIASEITFDRIFFATGKKFSIKHRLSSMTREDNLKEKLALERKEKTEYAKKVGQLTMQVDWLKKKSEETLGPDYESKFSPKPFED